MTDADTAAAIEALAHRIRGRDAAVRDGRDLEDAEPFALEFLTALRARGWRPTEAKAHQPWQRPTGHGSEPTADYLAARRALDEQLATRRHDDPDAA